MSDERPPFLVTIASPKGGVGKTMTTLLLAGEFASGGYNVLVIDTDPQRSSMRWYENSIRSKYPMKNIEVVAITDVEELGNKLSDPGEASIVLIDVQGTAVAALGASVVNADFVIIPTKAHIFDVEQCMSLIKHIEVLGGRHRRIPYGVLLNQVSGIDKNTLAFKTAYAALHKSKAVVLDAFLSQRPTFAGIATAGSLYEVDGTSKAIQDARDQTQVLAAEIIEKLNEAKAHG